MIGFGFANSLSYEETRSLTIFSSSDEGVADSTIARWFEKFREALVAKHGRIHRAANKIGGEGKIVQVDEAVLGRRKHHVGLVYNHQWV